MEKQIRSEVIVFPTMKECPEEIFFQDEENDLSYWEFVNTADSDADDVLSLSDASWHSSLSSSPKESPIADMIQDSDGGLPHRDYEPFHDDKYGAPQHHNYEPYIEDQEEEDDADHFDEDEEEEEDDDGYDLDDELVPRSLSGKFGRQRMRKLGKRACAKMNSSKKSPMLYVKPGCVRGKHGLGFKHSC